MKKVLKKPSASLNRLLQQSQYLKYLSKRLLTYLPAEFSNEVSVLGFSQKEKKLNSTADNQQQALIVLANSPAWASKLRFHLPTLQRSLRSEPQFSQISKIVIHTLPCNMPQKKNHRQPIYSEKSASIIYDTAQCIDDIDLKNALIHLAQNVKKPSSQ